MRRVNSNKLTLRNKRIRFEKEKRQYFHDLVDGMTLGKKFNEGYFFKFDIFKEDELLASYSIRISPSYSVNKDRKLELRKSLLFLELKKEVIKYKIKGETGYSMKDIDFMLNEEIYI